LYPYRDERGKIKQDRYVNIKPNDSYGEQLLEEVNAFWLKHAQGSLSGLEHSKTRLERIAEIPEEAIQKSLDQHVAFIKYEVLVHKCSNDKAINRMVAELKKAGKLPESYKPNHRQLRKILEEELLSNQHERYGSFSPEHQSQSKIRRTIKDIIVCYCNKKDYLLKYDWESLQYLK
jgi:hypothetical protein